MTDKSARAIALDPQWLPHSFGPDESQLTSVFVPREAHQALMFLSDDHYGGRYEKVTHKAGDIATHVADAPGGPMHLIFHTAFCCSTLMVKALDIPGRAAGLKEPDVLINVANRIAASDDPVNRQRLHLVLRLLARPYEAGETIIVKPSNFANRLIIPTLETMPAARAVLLHSDLPTMLRSVAKRGIWGRIWGRKLLRNVGGWTSLQLSYSAAETLEMTDLQVVGLAWLMQIHQFAEVAARMAGRVTIIDSADFMADPAATIGRVSKFFSLDLDSIKVTEIAAGPVFSRHSKFSQQDYSVDAREAEHDALVAAHGEEIDMVVKWVEAIAAHCRVSLKPSTPVAD